MSGKNGEISETDQLLSAYVGEVSNDKPAGVTIAWQAYEERKKNNIHLHHR